MDHQHREYGHDGKDFFCMRPTGGVTAKRRIYQSPLSNAPPVPRGTCGWIQDVADNLLFVDFDEPYGVVCCDTREVR